MGIQIKNIYTELKGTFTKGSKMWHGESFRSKFEVWIDMRWSTARQSSQKSDMLLQIKKDSQSQWCRYYMGYD